MTNRDAVAGTEGAALRVYVESFETDTERQREDPRAALREAIDRCPARGNREIHRPGRSRGDQLTTRIGNGAGPGRTTGSA